jgi:transcriptional regulator with XRE-family HTH domain
MTTRDVELIADVRRKLRTGEARTLRLAAGMNLAEVARALGVSRPTPSRWERCLRVPRQREALAYAKLLARLEEVARR